MLLNNRYQILKQIGSGGFGETFLAEDTHLPSRRKCVVKVLKPATATTPEVFAVIKDRFYREASILERLSRSSKQIPDLYAHFTEDNEFYLVQELIDGRNLLQIVESNGLFSDEQVKDFLFQLLSILTLTHSEGIIHRDIKPENVMCDGTGIYYLIDFGAVKDVITGSSSDIVIGSSGYMPLEQAAGSPTFASDLFSLGLTAAFLLTGKFPRDMKRSYSGEIDCRPFIVGSDPSLVAILVKATEQNLTRRYGSAAEMMEDLRRAGPSKKPTHLKPDGWIPGTLLQPEPVPIVIPPPKKRSMAAILVGTSLALISMILLIGLGIFGISTAYLAYENDRITQETERKRAEENRRLETERANRDEEKRQREISQAQLEETERKRREAENKLLELEKTRPGGKIEHFAIVHDQYQNLIHGMVIRLRFTVQNAESVNCIAAAYFSFPDGQALKDSNNDYKSVDGLVSVGRIFSPQTSTSTFTDFDLFMPYNELHLETGSHELMFFVSIGKNFEKSVFDRTEYVKFQITVP